MVKVYGNIDYSLLKYIYDKTYIYSVCCSAFIDIIFYYFTLDKGSDKYD